MRISTRFWCLAAFAVAVVLLGSRPAQAFYWSLRAIPTLLTPKQPSDLGSPPNPAADPIPLPPETVVPGVPIGPPGSVPEPATAIGGLIGLGLIISLRQRRKK